MASARGKRSPHQRRMQARQEANEQRRRGVWIGVAVAGVLVIALLVALASGGGGVDFEQTAVVVTGEPLPSLPQTGTDPAVGMAAPGLEGRDLEGGPLEILPDGRPKVLAFLAHWCPHCQAEVPEIQAHLDDLGEPEDVDLYGVVTLTDRTRGNWPPDEWLTDEGWTIPTLVDDENNDAADAYGLAGTPFWVAVDAEGDVVARRSGEIGVDGFDALVEEARGTGTEAT